MLKDTVIAGSAEDIRGTHLYGANDEKLGKISDVIFDHSTADIRYIVVETGWLHAKKFLVPAEAIRVSSRHEDDFEANLTKQQIENFPPFDESDLKSDAKWSAQGLSVSERMHPVSSSSERADWEAASRPTERVIPAGSDSVVINSNAEGIGDRWDTFQSHLRERRKEAVASCRTCSGEGASQRESESVENLRKAV